MDYFGMRGDGASPAEGLTNLTAVIKFYGRVQAILFQSGLFYGHALGLAKFQQLERPKHYNCRGRLCKGEYDA